MKQAHLFISLAIFLLASMSCTGSVSSSKEQSKDENKIAPEYKDVEKQFVNLSDFSTDAKGFIHLSGNESLKGWRGYGKDHLPSKWSVDSVDKEVLAFNSSAPERAETLFSPSLSETLSWNWNGKYLKREIPVSSILHVKS